MTPQDLHGIWSLTECYGVNSKGETVPYYGENPKGRLTYHPEGYMSAFLMRQGRRKFAGEYVGHGTPEELKEAFENFDSYIGTYTLDIEASTVTHHIEASRLPNWENTSQTRHFAIEGNTLRLRTDPIKARGDVWVVYVNWEKVV